MWRAPRLAGLAAILLAISGATWGQGGSWYSAAYRHLVAGNCERAVAALQQDLKEPDPPTLLLAGWLSQWGYCLERSGDKAWAFYERAHATGEPGAALRLAGLAATVAGGADVSAVLWWARKAAQGNRSIELADCDPFPGEPDVTDSAFVERLKSWPQEKLFRCRSEIGYLALVRAELLYPVQAVYRGAEGEFRLEYDLHKAEIRIVPTWEPVSAELVQHVESVARRSMQDLPRAPMPLTGTMVLIFTLR